MSFRILHWGPLIALGIIGAISYISMISHFRYMHPISSFGAFTSFLLFLSWNFLTLYNFFKASFIGPGYVDFKWHPTIEKDDEYLQFCNDCNGYKAPRSHHCRKCQRCCMKMDHHCPWINNCVGHFNHAYFIYFLLFAPLGCIHSICVLIPTVYHAIYKTFYLYYGNGTEPLIDLSLFELIYAMLAIGLAFGVIISVGILFYYQMKGVFKNETSIETWINEKAKYRNRTELEPNYTYPYKLAGWRENLSVVFQINARPQLDGIWWPVVEGCDQFTFTVEQMAQKSDKRSRSIRYIADMKFSGQNCPIFMGPKVVCCPPCFDEKRLILKPGDVILVSRFLKHWLYGEKIPQRENKCMENDIKERGWFPKKCASKLKIHSMDDNHSMPELNLAKFRSKLKLPKSDRNNEKDL